MPEIESKLWQSTAVRCFAGYRENERPLSFLVDDREIEVRTILDSWREPDHLFFRVEAEDGRVYEIRHHEYDDLWQVRVPAPG